MDKTMSKPTRIEVLRKLRRRYESAGANVKVMEGVFTPKQKQEMVHKLTDTMVSIEGENMRPMTLVVIEEIKSGDWGVAGRCPAGWSVSHTRNARSITLN
jgi:4-oxalocrotonate tautomerase